MNTSFEENIYSLIKELKGYDYHIDNIDPQWDIIFPDQKGKCRHIKVTKYQEVFYIAPIEGNLCMLTVTPNKGVETSSSFGLRSHNDGSNNPALKWSPLILKALEWLKVIKKDWIKANKQMHEFYPFNMRYGIVPSAPIKSSLPDIYKLDRELGKNKTNKFIRLVEEGYFYNKEKTERESMTANDFFDYCKIAYLASQQSNDPLDKNLSGRRMYELFADGRHEGLLDIDPHSEKEFADWIDGKHPKRISGGHPWEIRRGGNTTHIDLYVSRPSYLKNKNFEVTLLGPALSRLKETLCIFLAIYDAGLPITISDPKGIRKRLLAQDNIGIIPHFDSLHRANQHFHETENVYDVMHYDTLGKFRRRMHPFIHWEPLPLLKPSK